MKWPGDIGNAREMQERMRRTVRIEARRGRLRFVAGADAAFSESRVFAAACLYELPGMICRERATASLPLRFPYVPGFLSFREGPAIAEALGKLRRKPDVVLLDGQGIAHPRGFGIAPHLGVLLGIPSVGCAKSRLIGEYREPGRKKGSWSELVFEGRAVGAVLRTRDGVRPLFVSPGHLVDLEDSRTVVLASVGAFRIPEPLRCADSAAKRIKSGLPQGAAPGGATVLPADPGQPDALRLRRRP